VRRAPAFPDEVWQAIVDAAAPRTPDDQAHAALNDCIIDYFGLRKDRKTLHRGHDLWSETARLTGELGRKLWEIKRWTAYDSERLRRDMRTVISLQFHAEAQTEGLDVLLRARQGRRDPAREWLWWRLLAIWTDHFGGKVSVTKPRHGVPNGPLVRFITTVFERVLDEKISPHTLQDVVRRESERREGAGKGVLEGKNKSKPPIK
jgi:hypothetical protein